jgi:alpha-L-fucosidase
MYLTNSAEHKHHLATYGPPAKFGYKDFLPRFKAERFDAREWAALFKEAGARYVVPVAEHHDGFPMYDCSYTRWSATQMGPRRDILGELAKALRKEGLVFGASSHRLEHWWFMNGGVAFDSDVQDPNYAAFYAPARPEKAPLTKEFMDDWLARSCEIVDLYRPRLMWFDWWIEQPAMEPYRQKFAAYYYNRAAQWGEGVAINYKNKAFPEKAAVYDIERGQLAGINPHFWQTDTSVSKNSWGYVAKQDYKTATSIVQDLVDIVSKNGCLLLNIGPKPDGAIPEPEVTMLRDIGRWLKLNGEAIYGTRPWLVFGEGPTQVLSGGFTDTKRRAFTTADFRFTTRKDALYAVALAWPVNGKLLIRSLAKRETHPRGVIKKVTLLGYTSKLAWAQTEQGLEVTLPGFRPCLHAYTLKIIGDDLKPAPIVAASAATPAEGGLTLDADSATVHGRKLAKESRGGVSNLGFWDDPAEFVSWVFKCSQPGAFRVSVVYAAAAGDTQFVVEAAGQKLVAKVPRTGGWDDFQAVDIGQLEIAQPGEHTVMVGPLNASVWKPMNLRRVTLHKAP